MDGSIRDRIARRHELKRKTNLCWEISLTAEQQTVDFEMRLVAFLKKSPSADYHKTTESYYTIDFQGDRESQEAFQAAFRNEFPGVFIREAELSLPAYFLRP